MSKNWKHIVILGAGESGLGATLLAIKKGFSVGISERDILSDDAKRVVEEFNVPYEEHGHSPEFIAKADLIIKSPGIATDIDILKNINIQMIDEVEFASFFSDSTSIAITGTNGKTTTTSLIHHILMPHYRAPCLVGNIGNSVSKTLVNCIPDLLVTELSSFQIEGLQTYHPNTVVMTNITRDHLDRYNGSIDEYAMTKWRLVNNLDQSNYLIVNADDDNIRSMLGSNRVQGTLVGFSLSRQVSTLFEHYAYCEGDMVHLNFLGRKEIVNFSELPFTGKHQKKNVMAGVLAALSVQPQILIEDILKRLKSFLPIPHRMEPCGNINGITFINDSKATNVEATQFALDAFDQPIIWIAGGYDKGNHYQDIVPLAQKKVKHLVCLGKDNSKLKEVFRNIPITEANTMERAIDQAYLRADSNTIVLLSPMCASFDLFKNYIDRGHQFKEEVKHLMDKRANG